MCERRPRLNDGSFEAVCRKEFPSVGKPNIVETFTVYKGDLSPSPNNWPRCPAWPDNVQSIEIPWHLAVEWDLNDGNSQQLIESGAPNMNVLLKAVLAVLIRDPNLLDNVDFVTLRNPLNHMSATSVSTESWTVIATRFQGVNYVFREPVNSFISDRQRQFCQWGRVFEEKVITRHHDSGTKRHKTHDVSDASKWLTPLDRGTGHTGEVEEYYILFRRTLTPPPGCRCADAAYHMLCMAEIDCCYDTGAHARPKFVELKTHKVMRHPGHHNTFNRFKLPKVWFQSFWAGVDDIIFGFRDEDGRVQKLTRMTTSSIANDAMNTGLWKPPIILHTLMSILAFIDDRLKESPEGTLLKFTRPDNQNGVRVELDRRGQEFLLPNWFREAVRK